MSHQTPPDRITTDQGDNAAMRTHARPTSASKRRHQWRPLLLITICAILAGILGGYMLGRVTPAKLAALVAMLHPSAQHASPVQGAAPPTTPTVMFQNFNQALTSYQEQPTDLTSGLHLIIGKLHVNAPVVERGLQQGWMVVAPGNYVTHFIYSAYPGAIGNTVLYAHDTTTFRHLDQISVSDTVMVQTPGGTLQYRVRELRIVAPTDTTVLQDSDTPLLTLMTCYPFGKDTARLVVIADLITT